jgi:hypothetical protein
MEKIYLDDQLRHTLYGTCFANPEDRVTSTSETC